MQNNTDYQSLNNVISIADNEVKRESGKFFIFCSNCGATILETCSANSYMIKPLLKYSVCSQCGSPNLSSSSGYYLSTMSADLDSILGGGIKAGMLVVISSKNGKVSSRFLRHLCAVAQTSQKQGGLNSEVVYAGGGLCSVEELREKTRTGSNKLGKDLIKSAEYLNEDADDIIDGLFGYEGVTGSVPEIVMPKEIMKEIEDKMGKKRKFVGIDSLSGFIGYRANTEMGAYTLSKLRELARRKEAVVCVSVCEGMDFKDVEEDEEGRRYKNVDVVLKVEKCSDDGVFRVFLGSNKEKSATIRVED